MKRKSDHSTALLALVFFAGLSLLLYPSVSNYWNSSRATKAIVNYTEKISKMEMEEYRAMWESAVTYNQEIASQPPRYTLTQEEREVYNRILDVSGTGIMGHIEIPSIDVDLPIYHGTAEETLQVAAGHLEWTSFPVGGAGSHCVLSAHRGLPSAKLFTDLVDLETGDVFILQVLDEVLTYQVDQILIVKPHEIQALEIEAQKDYCTLITCTPYGINTHRLLVRGHRIENQKTDLLRVTSEALVIDPILVAPVIAAPVLLVLIFIVFLKPRKKER